MLFVIDFKIENKKKWKFYVDLKVHCTKLKEIIIYTTGSGEKTIIGN